MHSLNFKVLTDEERGSSPYKYELKADHYFVLKKPFPVTKPHMWAKVQPGGVIRVSSGYRWDGPSGPAIDTADWMVPSLVHDALYQLLEEKMFPAKDHEKIRKWADKEMRRLLKQTGMGFIRRNLSYWAVRIFGRPYAR